MAVVERCWWRGDGVDVASIIGRMGQNAPPGLAGHIGSPALSGAALPRAGNQGQMGNPHERRSTDNTRRHGVHGDDELPGQQPDSRARPGIRSAALDAAPYRRLTGRHGSARQNPYRSIASRVAMYTGLPTVVGWDWHQRQQRAVLPDAGVWSRIADVDNFYNTTDSAEAQRILDRYDVDYVYAGSLENVYYTPEGVAKLDAMTNDGTLTLIYDADGVKIYEVGRQEAE